MINRLYLLAFYSLALIPPIIFFKSGLEIYSIPKLIYIQGVITLMCVLYLAKSWNQKYFTIPVNKEQGKWLLMILVFLAVTWSFSMRPNISFWGDFSRQGGVISALYFILVFLFGLDIFKKKPQAVMFLKLLSISSFIVSLYAIAQKLGYDIFPAAATDLFAGRSFSSLGNPTILGAFLLFPIWSEIYLIHTKQAERTKSLFFLGALISALIFTENRASILALMGSGFLLALYYLKDKKWHFRAAIALGLIAALAFFGIYGKDMRSIKSRFTTWDSSIEMILERPIVGSGFESFAYRYEGKVLPEFFQYEDYFNLVDRPHNEFLEMWIHLGVAGAFFYFLLVFFVLKTFFTRKDPLYRYTSLAIISLLISNLFSFSLIIHYLMLSSFLAILIANKKDLLKFKWNGWNRTLALGLVLIVLLNLVFTGRTFAANGALLDAQKTYLEGDFTSSILKIDKAIKLAPQYAKTYTESTLLLTGIAESTGSEEVLVNAFLTNEKERWRTRDNLQSLLNYAKLLTLSEDYEMAENVYLEISEKVGNHPLMLQKWGQFYIDRENYISAALVYDELFNILPMDWAAPIISGSEMTESQRIFWKTHPDFIDVLLNAIKAYEASAQQEKATLIYGAIQ